MQFSGENLIAAASFSLFSFLLRAHDVRAWAEPCPSFLDEDREETLATQAILKVSPICWVRFINSCRELSVTLSLAVCLFDL